MAKRIVLIEDEDVIARMIKKHLIRKGYEVEVAEDGQKGLEAILEKKPDLVLLDMMLPVLNGFGVLRALKEKQLLPELPVVIISNSGQPLEIDHAFDLGIKDYLVKVNFTPEEVLEKVEGILHGDGDKKNGRKKSAKVEVGIVLVVEDDETLLSILARKFKKEGYAVRTATTTSEARRSLQQKGKPDVVLLDVLLPDESGLAFLQECKQKEEFKDIPFIVISNLGQDEEVKKGMDMGAEDYIIKANVLPEEIVQKVQSIIRSK
ncbi:response regulator [Patescibacteria group bacterium]|nr:response regulator [Patescibacteria group bacterium]